ncbi:MAG: ATP-binding protein [Bacteroidales bacterium]|jgi:two-component system phosphate regulon sensor histidine kinase PhoR|nr:two-component sensor histidine kinase [Bacteroidales bacterium]MDI9593114.1 ATP-binding protein [Bacteroidota bacterium]OQC36711.1 MAG: Alkaline phosphatase synthesis sensor protein PhoR [Bacteroidetes bacterium ADurb.Bin041]HOF81250.1 ATP-binding protein [Bacteroidales bacterium]
MKLSYRQRLFLYFGLLFTLFTVGIIVYEQVREKTYKTQGLQEKLETYTDIIQAAIVDAQDSVAPAINQLQNLLPEDLRITIINKEGKVLFDNSINDYVRLDNHKDRPEIVKAQQTGKGSYLRLSDSNKHKYLYFAKKADDKFIRVALLYNIRLQNFLKPDNAFLYFILLFFTVFIFFVHVTTKRLGNTIKQLRDFVLNSDKQNFTKLNFPNNEIGEIGSKIADNYFKLKESQKTVLMEKQKLLQHIQVLEEGICFLSPDHKVEYHNGLFIQYLNTIADEASSDASRILKDENFIELQDFLNQNKQHYFAKVISKQGKIFSVRANLFEDGSFEIILSDITKEEKTKRLKQEMTGNIAHELRTPITSIRGYLETVLDQPLSDEKRQYFIERAFQQTIALSEIIQDMSLITKMEEAPNLFSLEKINIGQLLEKIQEELSVQLGAKQIEMRWQVPEHLEITGNENLLYSLFRNLTDNAIRYGGENLIINISIYNEDADFYYFSFYDTGIGVKDESHLNRIFERFFCISEGRTRDNGGTGLGLSIVKNAVLFHKGNITVKNRKEGGLEFLFTLKKQ